jgi:molybdopterin/thiamine biosynthesis adenylyltransferase
MSTDFSYPDAFSRNIGWVTPDEQARLQTSCVAIAGLGGVGGVHLLTLARLGIGRFHIADFDTFSLVNFNRQVGATVSTLGRAKAEVLAEMVRDINPQAQVTVFPAGVTSTTLAPFLSGADVYVDGLDFFAFAARESTFAACHRLGVPAITAAPLGMGTAVLNFLPGQMSFESYFGLAGCTDDEKSLRFMIGLAPRLLQDYLVHPDAVDLAARKGPSTIMACQLCAGVAATEVLKVLLHRGHLRAAPHGLHFDAYLNKMVTTWRPWGHRNPIQRLMFAVGRRRIAQMRAAADARAQGAR